MQLTSLGDKHYKSPEYETAFFKDGGLIAGSTNKSQLKTTSGGKTIDFYTGLKLDGPLNKNMKTYKQVVAE